MRFVPSSTFKRRLRPAIVVLAAAFTAASLLASVALSSPLRAAESPAQASARATVTLVSERTSVAPGQEFRIGLRQKLAPHWHTYWKNPGDAGAAPDINLILPDGAEASGIDWPGPDAISVGPVRNFGYEDEIVLPISVKVPASATPGQTFTVKAEANWLVCEKECIPESGSFQLDLPIASDAVAATGEIATAFAKADARLPVKSSWSASLREEGAALALTVGGEGLSRNSVRSAFFYPEEWGVIVHAGEQKLTVEDGRLLLAMEKGQAFNAQGNLAGLLAVTDGSGQTRWFDTRPVAAASGVAGSSAAGAAATGAVDAMSLWQAALFAFLGGIILNLMPCVFPVLAIKATAVAQMSGGALRDVRLAGAFYTLGVLVAFLALAGALLMLRAGGGAVGWGFQFQSPLFVLLMSWVVLAIGLNLSGVFEIGLTITGAGQNLTQRGGHAGSFFTGLLAVVVATPCTAPFMGAAIGTALTAPPLVCLALFTFLGLGLAAPYALLGLFPRLARLLPRPGVWMLRLRQAMAFPMYATAAWLVWVLTQQTGDRGVMVALAGAVVLGLGAWAYGLSQHASGRGWISRGLAAGCVVALVALGTQIGNATAPASTAANDTGVQAFTAQRLAELQQQGKPVFVNMTAAWCITCLVNERTTLSTAAVKQAFENRGVIYLKGDWTNHNPEITAYLRSFSRDGLPFYAFYPAGSGNPVLLPPVLTEAAVVSEVQRSAAN